MLNNLPFLPDFTKTRAPWRLSLFEKAILINTLLLIAEALAGLWVTSHSLETHHYLIDTSFIVAATLFSVLINVLLLRASFRPLFSLLRTIRSVGAGSLDLRAEVMPTHSEVGELAQAFNTMLDQLESSRRQQAMLILQAQEEERRRVARELHDESSQNLTALLVHSEIISQTMQSIPDRAITKDTRARLNTEVHQLTQLTEYTLEAVRALALQLRPGILDDLGLNAALRWLAGDFRQRLHLPVELAIDGLEESLQAQSYASLYATTLFRIAQECLTNAARHAQAQHVFISFQRGKQHISFFVRDDGGGFDVSRRTPGLGIIGMRERAVLLGGTLTITSSPGKGTAIEARLPLLPNAPDVFEEPVHAVHL